MPKVICSKCGAIYTGWALIYQECFCDVCGNKLEVKEEGNES